MEQASILCKTLTTALNALKPQIMSPQGEVDSPNVRAYQYIATLLTRGVGESRDVVAVTGSRATATMVATFPASLEAVTLDVPLGPSQLNLAGEYDVTDVKPSHLSLQEIVEELHSETEVSLFAHASDILKALRTIQVIDESSSKHKRHIELTVELVLRRSYLKIKSRITDVKYIYDKPIAELLQSWVPELERWQDALDFSGVNHPEPGVPKTDKSEAWVATPPPISYDLFDAYNFPRSRFNGKLYCRLNTETIPTLLNVLARAYEDLRKAVDNYDPSDETSIPPYLISMKTLYECLYRFLPFLDVILRLRSLNYHLSLARIEPNRTESALEAEARAEYCFAPEESQGRVLIQYFKMVVAWNHAVYSLNRSKILRTGFELKLYIIRSPVDINYTKMLSADQLMDIFGYERKQYPKGFIECAMRHVQNSLKVEDFSGSVHCEAILMGLTVAAERGTPSLAPKLVDLLQGSNQVIGVCNKCCYCCDLLGHSLGIWADFQQPVSNGIVTPWAPPFGIPLKALHKVNGTLEFRLKQTLEKFAWRDFHAARALSAHR